MSVRSVNAMMLEGHVAAEQFAEYIEHNGNPGLLADTISHLIADGPATLGLEERAFFERLAQLAGECIGRRRACLQFVSQSSMSGVMIALLTAP